MLYVYLYTGLMNSISVSYTPKNKVRIYHKVNEEIIVNFEIKSKE